MPLQAADKASKPKASPAADRAATDPSNKSNSGEEEGKDEGEDKDKDTEDEELDAEEDEEEEVCGICLSGDFTQSNQIVFCEGKCGLGFHQKCYGIDTIPPGDEPWYCDVCAADQFGKMCSGYMYCCHYKHGLICRRLTIQDRPHEKHFAHVLCAVHMPYVDTSTVPFTTDVPKVTGDPIYCYFCDGRYGFQVRCSHPDEGGGSDDGRCQITFHPMCAFVNGFIKMPGVHSQPPEEYTCPEHDPSTRDGPLGQIRRKRLEKLHTSTAKSKKKIRRQEAQLERRLAAYGESSPRHKHSEKTRVEAHAKAKALPASSREKTRAEQATSSQAKATPQPKPKSEPRPGQASSASSAPRPRMSTRSGGPVDERTPLTPRITRSAHKALSAKGAKRDVKPSLAKESPSHRVATRAALRGKDHAPSRNIAPVDIDDVEEDDDDDDRTESLTVTPADKQASARPKHRDDSTEVVDDHKPAERSTTPQVPGPRPTHGASLPSGPFSLDNLAAAASETLRIGIDGPGNDREGKRAEPMPDAQDGIQGGHHGDAPDSAPRGSLSGLQGNGNGGFQHDTRGGSYGGNHGSAQSYTPTGFQRGFHGGSRGDRFGSISSSEDDYPGTSQQHQPQHPPPEHQGWPGHGHALVAGPPPVSVPYADRGPPPVSAPYADQGQPPPAKRPKLHIKPFARSTFTPGSGGGAPPYHPYPPPPPGMRGYSGGIGGPSYGMPDTAPARMRPPPSEQELWLRESREMLHAQATQLHQLQEIVRELVSQSGQRTNPALAINGSLSALMSEGSSPLQQPTPQFAHHNGYVFGGAPPPHYQQRAAPQPGQNYGYPVPTSAPVDIQLSRYGPRHRAADEPSPRTPLPPITPGRRESEHSAEEPRTGMDAELDKVKSHVMYLMKRVDMPRILLEQLTPTEEEGSTGRGRAFTALVADLKRLGALSRNNVKDYLEVFVRSLETAERD